MHPHDDEPMIDEADIAAIAWTVAVMRSKVLPFLTVHRAHHPDVCRLADPVYIERVMTVLAELQPYLDVYNERRAAHGKPPLRSFADLTLTSEGKLDA